MSELESCPFCSARPIFPEAKDVIGTCYEGGFEECGIASISIQIIDCFEHPRDHVHASWNAETYQYGIEYIEVARQEAIADWSRRAPSAEQHAPLMKFYNVTSVDALIEAQSRHIERLQAKLPASPSFAPNIIREG